MTKPVSSVPFQLRSGSYEQLAVKAGGWERARQLNGRGPEREAQLRMLNLERHNFQRLRVSLRKPLGWTALSLYERPAAERTRTSST